MAIGSNISMDSKGTFAFNAKTGNLSVSDKDHTFIINADNGLIIGATKNKGNAIGLTVNGSIRIGEAK